MNRLDKEYITNMSSKGTRMDGRKLDEFRKIMIEKKPIEKAEGSARVKLGKTDVIVGVKMGIGTPFPDRPDEGVLMTGAELAPLAYSKFETGPPRADAIELARVVDRGIRESGAIDTKKLCIEKWKKVWMVSVDIQIINFDGNLIDAASLAAVTALWDARLPTYDKKTDTIDYEKKTTKKLPVKSKPVAVTIIKIGDNLLVDPNLKEEETMDCRLTVTTKDDGNLCALQKGGISGLSVEEIQKAFEISVKRGKEIRKKI